MGGRRRGSEVGDAEIAWEEAMEGEGNVCPADGSRRAKPVKSRVPDFSRKNGTLLLYFFWLWCARG